MQSKDAAVPPAAELYDEIQLRAFEIYIERLAQGGEGGNALTDWLAAEVDVAERYTQAR
jgi:hypothetical protein